MEDFLKSFRTTVEESAQRLLELSEDQSEASRAPGKWTPKEIIGHLIDSAANNHIRFVKAQLCDHLAFEGYEQMTWVSLQRYNEEPWERLVLLWRNYNLHLAHLMSAISQEALVRQRVNHTLDEIAWKAVPKNEPATLEYFMKDYFAHLKNHLRQILDADGQPRSI